MLQILISFTSCVMPTMISLVNSCYNYLLTLSVLTQLSITTTTLSCRLQQTWCDNQRHVCVVQRNHDWRTLSVTNDVLTSYLVDVCSKGLHNKQLTVDTVIIHKQQNTQCDQTTHQQYNSQYCYTHYDYCRNYYYYIQLLFNQTVLLNRPSVLRCGWLGDQKGIRLVKVLPVQFQKVYFWGLAWPGVTYPGVIHEKQAC